MARAAIRVRIGFLLLTTPWILAPSAGADAEGSTPTSVSVNLTQRAALQQGDAATPNGAVQTSVGQLASVTAQNGAGASLAVSAAQGAAHSGAAVVVTSAANASQVGGHSAAAFTEHGDRGYAGPRR